MYNKYAELRDAYGLSDYAVAKKANIGRSTLSDWKKGLHTPSQVNLKKIAEVLYVSADYFIYDEMEICTCLKCGLRYAPKYPEDIKQHKKFHKAWEKAVTTYGDDYISSLGREDFKQKNIAIANNCSNPIQERYAAELNILRCRFSRSVDISLCSKDHPNFRSYVETMINSDNFKSLVKEDVLKILIENYGPQEKISDEKSIFTASDSSLYCYSRVDKMENVSLDEDHMRRDLLFYYDQLNKSGRIALRQHAAILVDSGHYKKELYSEESEETIA